ncbi:hypothetical protein TNIN_377231 [Trichonephila inaurata madagascariensis]|uniref:Uncharacterized protein n=1 Tax=Trichonephila inaurata madagascariensis TaxID=2747483 RepID=A0A8X6X943_9ARAC|nr:hypothetical protein TNIN_377231 [Trichonephila inaurata madagascariensis]
MTMSNLSTSSFTFWWMALLNFIPYSLNPFSLSLHHTRFAPNLQFTIPIQILSTANREETHSTATSNRLLFLTTTLCHTEPVDAYVIPHCTILIVPSSRRSPS